MPGVGEEGRKAAGLSQARALPARRGGETAVPCSCRQDARCGTEKAGVSEVNDFAVFS